MKKCAYMAVLLMMISVLSTGQDTLSTQKIKYSELNGHRFPSIATQQTSFINTSFCGIVGLGQTSKLTIPGIKIEDYEILAFEGRLLYTSISVHYQQKFNHWLAMFVSLKLGVRMGSDMSTILVDGLNTITGAEIGWLMKIYQGRKFNLAGSVSLRNLTGSFINVADYFKELINNNPSPSVIKVVPAMSAGAGIHFAYAISPTFGLQGSAAYMYGESFTRGITEGDLNCGLAFDADFHPAKRVPIGIALGYTITSFPDILLSDVDLTNIASARIAYTGSDDFELGLQYILFDLHSPKFIGTSYISNAILLFKYYF